MQSPVLLPAVPRARRGVEDGDAEGQHRVQHALPLGAGLSDEVLSRNQRGDEVLEDVCGRERERKGGGRDRGREGGREEGEEREGGREGRREGEREGGSM